MPDNLPSLAIVVVTYNSRSEIGDCLDSVVGPTASCPARIVVVDNQSSDGTAALVRARWPSVQVIEAGGNIGFARANNLGIAATDSELVLLLNPDTIVRPGAIRALVDGLVSHPDAAVAGPRLLDADNRPELSFGPPISPWGELWQKSLLALYRRQLRPVVRYIDRRTREGGDRSWVSGACLLIRRADIEAVGGLDERYFMYTEDVDLCTAVRARGRRVLFVPQAEVRHLRGRSAGRNPQTERLRRQSHLAFYEKHLPRWVGPLRLYLRLTGKGSHA
ncbi:MAG: glycosyltransferase family 2 protein [Acidobacteriota bacterium]|nr:glycosyltransferase family 2 protein [Acidobacteriota bacterium]